MKRYFIDIACALGFCVAGVLASIIILGFCVGAVFLALINRINLDVIRETAKDMRP